MRAQARLDAQARRADAAVPGALGPRVRRKTSRERVDADLDLYEGVRGTQVVEGQIARASAPEETNTASATPGRKRGDQEAGFAQRGT